MVKNSVLEDHIKKDEKEKIEKEELLKKEKSEEQILEGVANRLRSFSDIMSNARNVA